MGFVVGNGAVLMVAKGDQGSSGWRFAFAVDRKAQGTFTTRFDLGWVSRQTTKLIDTQDGTRVDALVQLLLDAIPAGAMDELRTWAINCDGPKVLCVVHGEGVPRDLPWEILSRTRGMGDLIVVRCLPRQPIPEPRPARPLVPLLVGTVTYQGSAYRDLVRELDGVEQTLRRTGAPIRREVDISRARFTELRADPPTLLHLAVPGLVRNGTGAALPLGAAHDGTEDELSADDLAALFAGAPPAAIVLSTPWSGGAFAGRLCELLETNVLGWLGGVHDRARVPDLIADLADGLPFSMALGRYERRLPAGAVALPTLWVPGSKNVANAFVTPRPRDAAVAGQVEPGNEPPAFRGGELKRFTFAAAASERREASIEMMLPEFLSPALLNGGKPPIHGLKVSAPRDAGRLALEVVCDAGSGQSVYAATLDLEDGRAVVPVEAMHFPVLFELMSRGATRRRLAFRARLSARGQLLAEVTRSLMWLDADEWVDRSDQWAMIPSFVTPNAAAVKTLLAKAEIMLHVFGKPTDQLKGYDLLGAARAVDLQLRAIFQAMRDARIAYVSPGTPVFLPTEVSARGQRVRLAEEIVTHRRGTCHDLALLMAACAEHVRIYPVIVLARGHTFVGFWKNPQAYAAFWEPRAGVPPATFGDDWLIPPEQLRQLAEDRVTFVDVTYVSDPTQGYVDACAKGRSDVLRLELDKGVDVWRSRYQIRPM